MLWWLMLWAVVWKILGKGIRGWACLIPTAMSVLQRRIDCTHVDACWHEGLLPPRARCTSLFTWPSLGRW